MQRVRNAVTFIRGDNYVRQVLSAVIHGAANLSVLPIVQLGSTVVKAVTVTVHPIHLGQYPFLRLAFGREGKVTDDLGARRNEFLLDVSPGLGHLRFNFSRHRWQCQQQQQRPFREPTPSLPESFESSSGSKVPERFDSVLEEDVEEKCSSCPVVGSVEPGLKQR